MGDNDAADDVNVEPAHGPIDCYLCAGPLFVCLPAYLPARSLAGSWRSQRRGKTNVVDWLAASVIVIAVFFFVSGSLEPAPGA